MPAFITPATPDSMADCYARRLASHEQVYLKPERQADLREIEAWPVPRARDPQWRDFDHCGVLQYRPD